MSRFQMSLNVADVDAAVDFYRKLLRVEPVKHRPGYANFVVDDPAMKLVLIEGEGAPGTVNHVGIEFADGAAVAAEADRVAGTGMAVSVDEVHTCCFATQDKAWTRDPDGVPWELYTVVEHADHFGVNPHGGTSVDQVLPPVGIDDVRAALGDANSVVIDAQGDGGFDAAHIEGAVDFSLDDVLAQADAAIADKARPVVIYCTDHDCRGSEFVGTQLVEAGYTQVRRFPGGIKEWTEAGNPTATDTP